MLHIDDINAQNNGIYELPEVIDVQNKIIEEFKDLIFIEEGHKYFLHDKSLPSVSEVTHHFCKYPFDDEEQSENYALKHGETPEFWRDKWKFTNLTATVSGTYVHEYAEGLGWIRNGHPELIPESCKKKYIPEKGWLIPTRKKEEAVLKFYNEWPENLHFVMAETKVYSNKGEASNVSRQFCGTFDLLAWYQHPTNPSKSGLVVLDWKTNRELIKEYSHLNKKMLLEPFGDYYEEPLSYYFLQLNLYSLCLAGIGLPVVGCRVIWLKEDGTYDLIPIQMVFKEEWFKKAF